jgi:hypothetical protein
MSLSLLHCPLLRNARTPAKIFAAVRSLSAALAKALDTVDSPGKK